MAVETRNTPLNRAGRILHAVGDRLFGPSPWEETPENRQKLLVKVRTALFDGLEKKGFDIRGATREVALVSPITIEVAAVASAPLIGSERLNRDGTITIAYVGFPFDGATFDKPVWVTLPNPSNDNNSQIEEGKSLTVRQLLDLEENIPCEVAFVNPAPVYQWNFREANEYFAELYTE